MCVYWRMSDDDDDDDDIQGKVCRHIMCMRKIVADEDEDDIKYDMLL